MSCCQYNDTVNVYFFLIIMTLSSLNYTTIGCRNFTGKKFLSRVAFNENLINEIFYDANNNSSDLKCMYRI